MNISNLSNKYLQWIKSMPTAKNYAKQNAGVLNHINSANTISKRSSAPVEIDKILYSGEVVKSDMKNYTGTPITECEIVPSSQREYTIGDALNYQYNKQFTINLEDIMSGNCENIKLRDPNSSVPQDFIERLQQQGIQEESYDSSRTEFYIMGLNEDTASIGHSIDYLASGYAVSKKHIEDNYVGEEKDKLLNKLESEYNMSVEIVAEKTAKEIGEFFSENGVSGETQKIHDSIVKAYNESIDKYSEYIKDGKDYANLNGTQNQWLKSDDSYMACQLRKAAKEDEVLKTSENVDKYYSLEEIEKTKAMVSEIGSYDNNGQRAISCYDSEEEIGFKLAELSLKGEVFNKYSDVSDSLKDAVTKSIQNFVTNITDKLNEELKAERKNVAEPETMADLNKNEIFKVYNKVISTYKTIGDMVKALKEGAVFGKNQHMDKTDNLQYSNLNRYGNSGSIFWNNFFQNTLKYSENALVPDFSNNGYIDKESGIETLSKNWNNFVSKFTNDNSVKLNISSFFGYA
ncbi:hypothetical protein [Anaerovorax odorimutans]|uniref:hypothetical protein n=1 Tax=Anaerovorax odorimutans TaxID=109327 RepID=UPI0003F54653|nr:hypothetical protein [Anaerovorax odorimutans]